MVPLTGDLLARTVAGDEYQRVLVVEGIYIRPATAAVKAAGGARRAGERRP